MQRDRNNREQMAGGGGASVPRLLSEQDVERYFGLKARTLQRWRLEGVGPRFRRLGGGQRAMVRYVVDDIERWISESPSGGGREASA